MMKIVSSLCAAAMAFTIPMAGNAMAMPKAAPSTQSAIVLVQDGQSGMGERGDRGLNREWRGRGDWRGGRGEWRGDREWRERGGHTYWRGHRGYREHRPGYRRHGDFWFPPAAFIAGAIVGGAIAQEPPVRYRPRGGAHAEWCYNRYRSYRASDNTFQPYNGPRQQCYSPYS